VPKSIDLDFLSDLVPPKPILPISLDPRQVLDRLPLADALLSILAYVLSPATLDEVFRTHRGRSFELVLSFPTLVTLIRDALLQHNGSGRQSFQRALEQGTLPTSMEAVYAKLRRIPMSLSLGLLETASLRLRSLFPDTATAWEIPPSLRGFTAVILDGKTLKNVAKRLKATRAALGKVSGGKLLVALAPQSGLVLTMAADPDGEANEARLVPQLLSRIDCHLPEKRLWIADRQFGDPVQIARFLQKEGDHVLVRWDGKTSFSVDPERPAVKGRDDKGREVIQEWGWLGAVSNKRRRYLRRVTLLRPGEENVVLLTDLLDEATYPAEDLLETYLARWGIERVFQQITEVFSLNRLIGSTPQATIFQASFCLVLYNLIQVVRGYIASSQKEVILTEDLSSEQIFYDAKRQLIATYELVSMPELTKYGMVERSRQELREWLQARLGSVWTSRWKKAKNKKARPKKSKTGSSYGAHNSVHRLVNGDKAKTAKPP
jgi:Transposase DDE domain